MKLCVKKKKLEIQLFKKKIQLQKIQITKYNYF